MRIDEVVIYKYFTKEDLVKLNELMDSRTGYIKLSDGTGVTKLFDGRLEFEVIEKDYIVDE